MDSNLYSSRKILTGAVMLLTGILVTYWKGDVPPNLMTLMITLFGFFAASNSVEHYTAMKISTSNNSNSSEDSK